MTKFKENANMFSIVDETKAPIIHGHTRIDLKDVKTGKRERIESDNTFMATTLAKQMRNLGWFGNAPWNNGYWRDKNMVQNLCGGVFLFKDAIPNNSEYMQAGNKMTANGCYNVVNNGNPPEFGSWNSIESNIDGNSSAVLVWDWSTSQGNGQISSVCLTSEKGGYIGYGNASGYSMTAKKDITENVTVISGFVEVKKIYNNIGFNFSYTSPTLTIQKYRYPVSQASIFDKKIKTTRNIDLSTYGVTIPTNAITITNIENNKAMICENKNIANNETFTWLLYDYTNDSIEVKSVVNTTGVTIPSYYFYYLENEGIYVVTTTVTPFNLYTLDETTGAIIKTIDVTSLGNTSNVFSFGDNLLSHNAFSFITDLVNETIYPTNAYFGNYAWMYAHHDDYLDAITSVSSSRGRASLNKDYIQYIKNPLYLATINNLQDSVTKQNTQTMKVTYTLTEV